MGKTSQVYQSMISLHFTRRRNLTVQLYTCQIELDHQRYLCSETLDFGQPFGAVKVEAIARAAEHIAHLTDDTCQPQLAALIFNTTGYPRALDWYFPVTNMLPQEELSGFDRLRENIAGHPAFDLKLVAESRADVTALMPAEIRHLVAGHLAEIFYSTLKKIVSSTGAASGPGRRALPYQSEAL